MELWIRSQDRRVLTKVDEIWISNQNAIYCNNDWEAGQYETEERALEVLDEIQKLLMPQVKAIYNNKIEEVKLQDFTSDIIVKPIIEDIQIQQLNNYVYEMPKE